MDKLFGDAASAISTPAMTGETAALVPGSPVSSMDLRRGVPDSLEAGIGPSRGMPRLDLDPPAMSVRQGKPQYSADPPNDSSNGWVSRMLKRGRGRGQKASDDDTGGSRYKPLDQQDE